ncbi:MAG: DUF4127 family protein [Negativicutes bacterium]|nr:DUF4127 family protein [Negativicutes bacterium]
MRKRFFTYLVVMLAVTVVTLALTTTMLSIRRPIAIQSPAKPRLTIVLLPLDSRPPCTQFVEQLAAIADIRLILPPSEMLDNYKTPGNKKALREWLSTAITGADAAIVSTDMLIHGGLLASRLSLGTADDVTATVALLENIHHDHPTVKLYGFNIIPRLLLADSAGNAAYQNKMLKYSLLKDEVLAFENPTDIKELQVLEQGLPPEIIQQYQVLHETSVKVNQTLIDLADNNVLAGLVIGQDDGQPFGLPNLAKNRLQRYLSQRPELAGHVFITRGTDEVALTLLGHIATQDAGWQPRVFVKYSQPESAGIVMPFMPHSVSRTVEEKLAMVGAIPVEDAATADYTLYVHIGTHKTKTSSLLAAAKEVGQMVAAGQRVALVDLSEDFYGHETLLPYLLKEDVTVNRLIAYAGWNTTSNSIGTAVTQATLFSQALDQNNSFDHVLRVYKFNLEFLAARFLDDWYYQKDVQVTVKNDLHNLKIDANNLGNRYQEVNHFVQRLMSSRATALSERVWLHHPLPINTDQGPKQLTVLDMQLESRLPWQRTFEVWLQPTLSLAAETKSL